MQRYTLPTAALLALTVSCWIRAAEEAAPADQARAAQADQLERALAADSEALYTYWPAQLYLGGKIGTERSLGEVNIMAPVWQHDTGSLYVDLRSRFDDDDTQEYNLGGGYRHILNKDMILGAYGFFDVLNSEHNNTFLQGLVGVELLMEDWRFRGNWYIPQNKEETLGTTGGAGDRFAEVRGNSIVIVTPATFELTERSLGGFDVEVGRRLPVFRNDLWVYAAYFNFHEDGYPRIEGPRLRAEYLIPLGPIDVLPEGSHAIIGGEWQHDNVRGSQAFATFGIRIPLGSDPKEAPPKMTEDWKYWAMISRVQRDIDIVTGEKNRVTVAETLEAARNPVNPANPRYSGIYYADPAGTGIGTEADPTDIDTAANMANTMISPDGIAGVGADGIVGVLVVNDQNDTNGIGVADNGTVISAGETLDVVDAMGTHFNVAVGGTVAGTINGTDNGSNTLTIADGADNVLVQGTSVIGTGLTAIMGTNNDNLFLTRTIVVNYTGDGITLDGVGDLMMVGTRSASFNTGIGSVTGDALTIGNGTGARVLDNFLIVNNDGIGLHLNNNTGTTTVTNLQITGSAVSTVAVVNSNETATFSDTDIEQDNDGAILTVVGDSSNVTFDATTTLTAASGTGIAMDTADGVYNFNGPVALNNDSATVGATLDATFSADSSSGTVVFDDLTITNPSTRAAVAIGIGDSGGAPGNAVAASFTFNDLTITSTSTAGFVADDSHNITVAGPSTITTTGAAGLAVSNLTGADIAFNSVSANNAAAGITVDNVDGVVAINGGTVVSSANSAVSLNVSTAITTDFTIAGATLTGAIDGLTAVTNDVGAVLFLDASGNTSTSTGAGFGFNLTNTTGTFNVAQTDEPTLQGDNNAATTSVTGAIMFNTPAP